MKILIFTNSLAGGGTERVAATLANFWARQNRDVTVVTLDPESQDFYVLNPSVKRVTLNLSGASANVFDALRQNGRRVLALRRVIKQVRPDVALSMMSTPNVLLAFASRGIPNLCTVGSEHCYPPHAPLGRIWGTLCSRMYGKLSAVVALTRECAEWIATHSSAPHVSVIPNAATWPLPDSSPKILPHSLCSPERKVLLAVGRLNVVKNYEALLAAFAQLAGKHPDWDLVILGEGPERASLESTIRARALGTRVLVPGIAGNVGEWYARADLYVMTSRSEGFPMALAEALAHGVPAVSFDCDTGPRDIIRHGVDGLLVPANDTAALTEALDRVMGDANLREQLAARAPEARARFSIEKIAGMWEELFAELSDTRVLPKLANNVPATKGGGHEF
ncbi:glycosyltransferase family 4 protein [Massilia niabensis]|uniref:Glycosyltransferase family 4 protein n=1 Tax=Massilia niabensis TaxID=544910 RepID=A0ABW0KXT6_9BURK